MQEQSENSILIANCRSIFKNTAHSTNSTAAIRAVASQGKALRTKLDRRLRELCFYLTDCDELHAYERKAAQTVGALIATAETKHKTAELGVEAESKCAAEDAAARDRWQRLCNKEVTQSAVQQKSEQAVVDADTRDSAGRKAQAEVDEKEIDRRLDQLQREWEDCVKAHNEVNAVWEPLNARAEKLRAKRQSVVGGYKPIDTAYRDSNERVKLTKEIKSLQRQSRASAEVRKMAESIVSTLEEPIKVLDTEFAKLSARHAADEEDIALKRQTTSKLREDLRQRMQRLGMNHEQLDAHRLYAANFSGASWQSQYQGANIAIEALKTSAAVNDDELKVLHAEVQKTDDAIRSKTKSHALELERIRNETQHTKAETAKLQDECLQARKSLQRSSDAKQAADDELKETNNLLEQIQMADTGALESRKVQLERATTERDKWLQALRNQKRRGMSDLSWSLSVAQQLLRSNALILSEEFLVTPELRELNAVNESLKWLNDRDEHERTHPGVSFAVLKPAGLVRFENNNAQSDAEDSASAAATSTTGSKKRKRSLTAVDGGKRDECASESTEAGAILASGTSAAIAEAEQALQRVVDANKDKGQHAEGKLEPNAWQALPMPVPVYFDSKKSVAAPSPTGDDEELQPLSQDQQDIAPKKPAPKPPSVVADSFFKDMPLAPKEPVPESSGIAPIAQPMPMSRLDREPSLSASEQSHEGSARTGLTSFRSLSGAAPTKSHRSRQPTERPRGVYSKGATQARDSGKSKPKSKGRGQPVPHRPADASGTGLKRRTPAAVAVQQPERPPKRLRRESRPHARPTSIRPATAPPVRLHPRAESPRSAAESPAPAPAMSASRLIRQKSRTKEPTRKLSVAAAGAKTAAPAAAAAAGDPFEFSV